MARNSVPYREVSFIWRLKPTVTIAIGMSSFVSLFGMSFIGGSTVFGF